MSDLIDRLGKATEAEQADVLRDAIEYAWLRRWITQDVRERAKEWIRLGAYESAALTLVPEGARWNVGHDGATVEGATDVFQRGHTCPALALAIAALLAREPSDGR